MRDFPWPLTPGAKTRPEWTGSGFLVDGEEIPVLIYCTRRESWDDELTVFHERIAGSDHFIDIASRRSAVAELKSCLKKPDPVVLEIGSSSGFLLPAIEKAYPHALVIGSDSFPEALERLARTDPTIPLLGFDLMQCPLPDNCVDAVVLLNVLEHIKEDEKAMRMLFRILKPGGIAILEVPSGSHLFDIYDELLRHYRRYDMKTFRSLTENVGFEVLKASHLGFFAYPGFALVKKRNQLLTNKDAAVKKNKVASEIGNNRKSLPIRMVMGLEFVVGRLVSYPFGIRCLLNLRKPLT
jgi:SAM-dependent methyltransferase